jgi:hypothetical protein
MTDTQLDTVTAQVAKWNAANPEVRPFSPVLPSGKVPEDIDSPWVLLRDGSQARLSLPEDPDNWTECGDRTTIGYRRKAAFNQPSRDEHIAEGCGDD